MGSINIVIGGALLNGYLNTADIRKIPEDKKNYNYPIISSQMLDRNMRKYLPLSLNHN